jgi:hypothetical protein
LPSPYKNEDEAIKVLFRLIDNYNRNPVHYTLFPDNGKQEYNSNSFVRGIGAAAGFDIYVNTGARTPGYTNQVPAERFR